MKIKAAVLHQSGLPRPFAKSRPLSIEEIELDPPKVGEVLVQIKAAGLCHSDLAAIDGERPRPTPMVIGHEAAGVVAELGPGVTGLSVGDHVVPTYVSSCGHCEMCSEGRPALCQPAAAANQAGILMDGTTRLHRNGQLIHHHSGVAAFAEYAVISQDALVKIDPEILFEQAALFGCAVVTGVGSVVNTAKLAPGQSAAIVGLGGVGLSALLAAIASGAGQVVAVDVNDDKLGLARQLGAHEAFNAKLENCAEKIRTATEGGVHFAFETAGVPSALDLAYRITRRGGTTVAVGMPGPDASITLSHLSLAAEERTIKGSYMGSCVPCPYHKLDPDVRMVETTEVRYGSDPAFPQNWPCQWRIFAQRQVSAGTVVVIGVGPEHAAQMCLADNDQMVQTFPSDRSDQPLNVGVLPRRTGCRGTIPNTHGSDPSPEYLPIGAITIANKVFGRRVPRKGFRDLASDPIRRWVRSHREMNQLAPFMTYDEQPE